MFLINFQYASLGARSLIISSIYQVVEHAPGMSLFKKTALCIRRLPVLQLEARSIRLSSNAHANESRTERTSAPSTETKSQQADKPHKKPKTMAELDKEMRSAMENLAGDGGEAGVELEGGKAVAMKRGVRENMFRYI